MARTVMFANASHGFEEDRRALAADEYVDIDMSVSLDPARTDEEGAVVFTKSSYAIWARPRGWSPIGYILREDDRAWLERTPREYGERFLCRVNQTNVVDPETGARGFLVEFTSGIDSRQLVRAHSYERWLKFAKQHWWKVGLVALVAWWWLFIR